MEATISRQLYHEYPVSAISEGYRPLIQTNPLPPIVEAFRYAFLGTDTVSLSSLLHSAGGTLVVNGVLGAPQHARQKNVHLL